MTVMTLGIVEKQPAALRGLIGKYLAAPRWQDSCDFYNQMMERER
ncbi:replication protein B, partial [Salmonella enterica]|nr:replication protein B [Salmonella enterica subsp. enterica serovar Montevideo]EEI6894007.1 replication protein B [Salmonella enterica]